VSYVSLGRTVILRDLEENRKAPPPHLDQVSDPSHPYSRRSEILLKGYG